MSYVHVAYFQELKCVCSLVDSCLSFLCIYKNFFILFYFKWAWFFSSCSFWCKHASLLVFPNPKLLVFNKNYWWREWKYTFSFHPNFFQKYSPPNDAYKFYFVVVLSLFILIASVFQHLYFPCFCVLDILAISFHNGSLDSDFWNAFFLIHDCN